MDVAPNFRLPSDILQLSSGNAALLIPDALHRSLISLSNTLSDISHALNSVAKLFKYLNENESVPGFWTTEMVYFKNVLPVTHEVLELPRYNLANNESKETQVLREVIRKTCLLWLVLVKRRFFISPDGVLQHRDMLLQFLSEQHIDWTISLQPLRLWIFVTLAVAFNAEFESLYIAHIASAMREMKLSSWTDAIVILKSIAWTNELGSNELRKIGVQLCLSKE